MELQVHQIQHHQTAQKQNLKVDNFPPQKAVSLTSEVHPFPDQSCRCPQTVPGIFPKHQ